MENHSYGQVVNASAAPYENTVLRACGLATNYHGITHPSLPNYIAATGGTTAGISSDCSPKPSCFAAGSSIFGQVATSGRQWRSYQESMPSNCLLSRSGQYAPKHNPAAYYTAIRSQCTQWDVSFDAFSADLSNETLPAFAFVTPNLCNDTHNCPVAAGDRWLKNVIGSISKSATYRAGRTAIFITWDEGFSEDDRVPMIVIAPSVRTGTRSMRRFDHYSLLRTTEEMLGLRLLGRAAQAASMRADFRL